MASQLRETMARQLRLPAKGLMGWVTMQVLKRKNFVVEKNAARLCNIQPHHRVLEIGFGPGIGIEHALFYVKDGPGKICGVDLSPYCLEQASYRLRNAIQDKKVELSLASVIDLPYATDSFDSVFHTNCYFFWPSMRLALQEIHRVMKPGANMITALNLDSIRKSQAKGWLKYGNPDPVNYMCALEMMGFEDVRFEYLRDGDIKYQAIFAHL
ncbi:hypothetical protein BaRGS_00001506, partial [Batillaria attramentaria]